MRGSKWALAAAMVAGAAAAEVQVSTDSVSAGFGEPMVAVAPDGAVYIAALQGFFRSDDNGGNWTKLTTPLNAAIVASDSSIAIDPAGNVYLAFDYPYAGSTASCTSTNRGVSWTCNPVMLPGGTDRMWNVAPSATEYYVTTNAGLYQTALGYSNDGGLAFQSYRVANEQLEPYAGTLVKVNNGTLVQASDQGKNRGIMSWVEPQAPSSQYPGQILAPFTPSGLARSIGLPSLARTSDDALWLVGTTQDAQGNNPVQVARRTGADWTLLTIPGTEDGSAVFPWIVGAEAGHIGVVFYRTAARSAGGAPTPNADWATVWAETFDARAAKPHWTLTTVEAKVHTGTVCTGLNCEGGTGETANARFASDFISAAFAPNGDAHLAWVSDSSGSIGIRHARVVTPHAPVMELSANAASVTAGEPIALTWTVAGARACAASGDWNGNKSATGGSETLNSGADSGVRNYVLACSNNVGTATQSVQVVVVAQPPPPPPPPPPGAPSVTLTAAPGTVTVNEDVRLTWGVSNATACTASGAWSGSKSASGGSETVNVGAGAGTRAYTLTCSNVAQSTSRTADVTVQAAQAPPQNGGGGSKGGSGGDSGGGGGGGGALSCGTLLLLGLAVRRRRNP